MIEPITDEQFEVLVNQGIDAIPEKFLNEIKNVAILIDDLPTPEQVRRGRVRHGWFLLGLYEGIPRIKRDNNYSGVLPDRITIFKLPLMAAARDAEHLKQLVKNTVWHEIAHYFGLDHADINKLEVHR